MIIALKLNKEQITMLYSERNRDTDDDVYIYDDFSPRFRTQYYYIIQDTYIPSIYENAVHFPWVPVENTFKRQKGLLSLWDEFDVTGEKAILHYIMESISIDLLDFIESSVNCTEKYYTEFKTILYIKQNDIEINIKKMKLEINEIFRINNMGYEFIDKEIIRKDNEIIHATYNKPAIHIIHNQEFEGANSELMDAYKSYREKRIEDAITNAGKSFESVMKVICVGMEYSVKNKTASGLLNSLKNNNFYPEYLECHLSNIVSLLESGLPAVRNALGPHGQGNSKRNTPPIFGEYALGLVSVNILLLVKLYEEKKGKA